MTKRANRRPYTRATRKARKQNRSASSPIFQPLEPRKLLTTLYAFPDLDLGQTNTFAGWIAMPAWYTDLNGPDGQLNAEAVESRSVFVRIQIFDTGAPPAGDSPSVTILDLNENPLFPWIGQLDDGDPETEVEVAIHPGEDGYWGSDDDVTFGGFGLDVGYNPGWRNAVDSDGNFIPGLYIPDNLFDPVRQIDYEEDPDLGEDETFWPDESDDVPEDRTLVIPETGTWHPGSDGVYRTADDSRTPPHWNPLDGGTGHVPIPQDETGGTDDRVFDGSPLTIVDDDPSPAIADPFTAPTNTDQEWHLIDRIVHGFDGDFVIGVNDGIADFNNGIGQIIFADTRSTTRFVITVYDDPQDYLDNELYANPFQLPEGEFVGTDFDRSLLDGTVIQTPGMGRVIIGNPTNADWRVIEPRFQQRGEDRIDLGITNPEFAYEFVDGREPLWQRFSHEFENTAELLDRPREGIYFEDPSENNSMGRIAIDGALYGVSRFPGALEILHVGFLGGDVIVDGDTDAIIVAGNAGVMQYEDDSFGTTNSRVNVGRAFGSFIAGDAIGTLVNVDGDFSAASLEDKPFIRDGGLVLEYEQMINDADIDIYKRNLVGKSFEVANFGFVLEEAGEEEAGIITNDTIGRAQYIGRATGRALVNGTIGGEDQFHTDAGDWYSVAVDGETELRVSIINLLTGADLTGVYLSIRDHEGRILASRGLTGLVGEIKYKPKAAGVVYIVVGDNPDGSGDPFGSPVSYQVEVRGVEGVTLGEVNGLNRLAYSLTDGTSISTQFGDIGAIRVGLDAEEATNFAGSFTAGIINTAGSLWQLSAGSTMGGGLNSDGDRVGTNGVTVEAAEHVGQIFAGYGTGEGDGIRLGGSLLGISVEAGGNIGHISAFSSTDLDGGIGDFSETQDNGLVGVTGAATFLADNIGVIHASNRIQGYTAGLGGSLGLGARFEVRANGVIDLVEAGVDMFGDEVEGNEDLLKNAPLFGFIDDEPGFFKGVGGNIRFVRAPQVFATNVEGAFLTLAEGESIDLVDDSGATFSIKLTAGSAAFGGGSGAKIVFAPVTNSLGVAVTQIVADLSNGADLVITNNSGRVEIGDIVVMGANVPLDQKVILNGSGRTDVLYLRAAGQFEKIENSTSGDMIAIDVDTVEQVKIAGNLGRTNTVKYGPQLLGPELGFAYAAPTQPPATIEAEIRLALLNGAGTEVPFIIGSTISIDPAGVGGAAGDPQVVGGITDEFLNGLIVRETRQNFAVESVQVDGALGDLIANTTIESIKVNADGNTPLGAFHGVVGTVYSRGDIEFIDVGDGLVATDPGPWLNAGILAQGSLHRVFAEGEGHDLKGYIGGAGVPAFAPAFQDFEFAIQTVETKNGADIDGAVINADSLEEFWAGEGSSGQPTHFIDKIQVRDGDMRDTLVRGRIINDIEIKGGVWDANRVFAPVSVGRIRADEFTATTDVFAGAPVATIPSEIIVGGNIDLIETWGGKGNILNLDVDILGNLGRMRANDIELVDINVDNFLERVDAKGAITRSNFVVGAIEKFEAGDDIARVTVDTAGIVKSFKSKSGEIYLVDVTVGGPDGEIQKLEAATDISGSFVVSGPINKVRAKSGDITATIITTGERGTINDLQAGRDLLLTLDASADVNKIRAGRTLGDGDVIRVRGDVSKVDVKNGTFDAQLIVDGELSKFQAGTMAADASIDVQRSINKIDIDSGVDGDIVSHFGGINKIDISNGGLTAGNEIAAYDGGIKNLSIKGGDVAGTIFSEDEASKIQISSSGGVGGNLTGVIESELLLKKVDIDGSITGGQVKSLFEIGQLNVGGDVTSAIIGAGQLVSKVNISGDFTSSFMLGGLESLGADNAIGGTLLNADRFSNGHIENSTIGGEMVGSVIAAGILPTAGGSFASPDPDTQLAPGRSTIDKVTIRGDATSGSLILADTAITNLSINGSTITPAGGGVTVEVIDPTVPDLTGYSTFTRGSDAVITEADGDIVRLSLSGSGTGYFIQDGSGNISDVLFLGTQSNTNVVFSVDSGSGDGFVNLALGTTVEAFDDLFFGSFDLSDGAVDEGVMLSFDADINTVTFGRTNTTGTALFVGGEAKNVNVGNTLNGTFDVTHANSVQIVGNFSGNWQSQSIGSFHVTGSLFDATVYGRDGIDSVSVNGALGADEVGTFISTDENLNSLTAASAEEVVVSAEDVLNSVTINGNAVDSSFIAGLSLGSDGDFGGTGTAADELTSGEVNNVTVRGDFIRSSVAAGIDRGTAGFFGDGDDIGALGYSVIHNVTVNGLARGSNFFTESYAFTAAGEVENVRVNRSEFTQNGNLQVRDLGVASLPVLVTDVTTRMDAETFVIEITFSEDIDEISLTGGDPLNPVSDPAISFENSDPTGNDPTTLDYTITYDPDTRTAEVVFETSYTRANPGVYRLVIDGTSLQSTGGVNLDGDGDGVPGDDYEKYVVLGDAGDRVLDPGDPNTWDYDGDTIDDVTFRNATDMDLLLTELPSSLRKNLGLTFVGRIGDHPDHEANFYPGKMDVDVYSVTLEEGDIFQATLNRELGGAGLLGSMFLLSEQEVAPSEFEIANVVGEDILAAGWRVTADDTYYLAITSGTTQFTGTVPVGLQETRLMFIPGVGLTFGMPVDLDYGEGIIYRGTDDDPLELRPDWVTNDIGNYSVTVEIFDDGDSGFDRGNQTNLVDGVAKTFHSQIGRDTVGFADSVMVDVDVWDINFQSGGNVLSEGTTVTMTLAVEEFGSDLGAIAEFGLFRITDDTSVNGGELVGAPGYIDLYSTARDQTITVRVPTTGVYAVYVQGNLENDYSLTIEYDTSTAGTISLPARQNVLLETNGGFAEWLGRFGTDINKFNLNNLGFGGQENTVLSTVIDEVETKFENAGVTVNLELNSSSFGREPFSTVFLANNYSDDVDGVSEFGAAEQFDVLNQDRSDSAVVFVEDFDFYSPGSRDLLAEDLANVVAREIGHLLGLRNVVVSDPVDVMTGADAALLGAGSAREFSSDPLNLARYGGTVAAGLRLGLDLTGRDGVWLLGQQDDVDMLQYVLASSS
ncbi:MAG: beta strand repeat-containing protein [Phycisphaerales bacterium]